MWNDETNNIVGRNANGKRVLDPGSLSEERIYHRSVRRKVNTTSYSVDVLVGKMNRLTTRLTIDKTKDKPQKKEDKSPKRDEPEEVIVWKGNYIVCN